MPVWEAAVATARAITGAWLDVVDDAGTSPGSSASAACAWACSAWLRARDPSAGFSRFRGAQTLRSVGGASTIRYARSRTVVHVSQDPPAAGAAPDPAPILQLGLGFWGSKTLLSAVELGVFTELADGPLDVETLRRLGLHPRAARDFLDALVALGMLSATSGGYREHPRDRVVPGPAKPCVHRRDAGDGQRTASIRFWGAHRGLRTGSRRTRPRRAETSSTASTTTRTAAAVPARHDRPEPGRRTRDRRQVPLGRSYRDVHRRRHRPGRPAGAGRAARTRTSPAAASTCPQSARSSTTTSPASGSSDRLRFHPGDFFNDPLPQADVLAMGHILHDWDLDEKLHAARQGLRRRSPTAAR